MDDELIDLGPLDWNLAGVCPCGLELPPVREWRDSSRPWSWTLCACGRLYVDEDDYLAIHRPAPEDLAEFLERLGPLVEEEDHG